MTRTEYLERLCAAMAGLPAEETQKTVEYYDEMISDAMEAGESEAEAVNSLPSPEDAADDLRLHPVQRKGIPGWGWALCGAAVCGVFAFCVLLGLNLASTSKEQSGTLVESGAEQAESQEAAAPTESRRHAMSATTLTYGAEELSAFNLKSPLLAVEVVGEDRQDIEITYYDCPAWRCAVEKSDGELALRYPDVDADALKQWKGKNYTIQLRVPREHAAEYRVDAAMGAITLSECSGSMRLDAAMGSITLSGCTGERMDLDAAMGGIELSDCLCDRMELNAAMGSIELTDVSGERLSADCALGSIALDGVDCRRIELETDLGAIEGTVAGTRGDYSMTCGKFFGESNVLSGGDGPRTLALTCSMGNVDLTFLGD